jgi:hypothetical protein
VGVSVSLIDQAAGNFVRVTSGYVREILEAFRAQHTRVMSGWENVVNFLLAKKLYHVIGYCGRD